MADKGKDSSFARSTKSLQDNVTRAAPAMAASYSLVGAIILFGAIGYVLYALGMREMLMQMLNRSLGT